MALVFAILGVVCVLYGASVLALGSGTWFFAVWFALGAVLLLAAVATRFGWWEAVPSVLRYVGVGVLAVLLAGFLATQALIAKDFGDKGEPGLDAIIVLGAQMKADGPSWVLRFRLNAAYDYLVENPETVCIVSGGQGPNEPVTEAQGMADYLVARGIEPERIILEDRATNTLENIRYSMEFIDAEHDRVGIVTNNFHVYRGVTLARACGIQNVCGIAAYSTPFYLPNNLLRESMGIVKDFVSGNFCVKGTVRLTHFGERVDRDSPH